VVVYAVVAWATRSRPGRVWAAIRENETRVTVLGLHPYTFKLVVFVLGSFLATLAGVVYLFLQGGATPQVTTPEFTLALLVMVVLGGAGYRWGAVVGGVVYMFLDQRLGSLAASHTIATLPSPLRVPLSQPLFLLGVLFIVFVMFVPGGIAAVVRRVVDRTPGDIQLRTAPASRRLAATADLGASLPRETEKSP
jgi:branched-chain amino acid transport system permease protein